MPNENYNNLQYFEASSMAELFSVIKEWNFENKKRFLSLHVQLDRNLFCCIALTNPSEVIIVDGWPDGVKVKDGALRTFI